MIAALALAAGLTVVSAAPSGGAANTWACAYVGDRLPQSLRMLGEDAVSSEDTRAARKKLMLSDAILTRASSLTLARAVGATRLVIVRCVEQKETITLEAQTFDVDQPIAGEPLRVSQPSSDVAAAVDVLARRLTPKAPATIALKAPSAKALSKAGPALKAANANERAAGLTQSLLEDPGAVGLRLTTVEALMAARDFDSAIRIADAAGANLPANALGRSLRFSMGASLLEAGRYAEARDVIEGLRKEKETAAILNNLGVALFRLREAGASTAFERATSLKDHRQGDIAFNRSLALIFESRGADALPSLDLALKANPSDVRSRLLRVWALKTTGRESERLEEWDRLMAIAPSFAALAAPDLARRLERILSFERIAAP